MPVAATLTRIFRRSKRKELFDAVCRGDVDAAEALIKQGIPVHIRDRHGRTLMSHAAENGHTYIVLLLRGAGAVFKECGENSLVGYAVANGHLVTAKALIELGADVNGVDKNRKTPLFGAAESGDADAVSVLLAGGASCGVSDARGRTALLVAVEQSYVSIVRALLNRGAKYDVRDGHGRTSLTIAVERGNIDIARLLLEHGATTSEAGGQGRNQLSVAVQNRDIDMTRMLIDNGAMCNEPDTRGRTPLLAAAENGDIGIVQMLLASGAPSTDSDKRERTPLFAAIENGGGDVAQLLLHHVASLNESDQKRIANQGDLDGNTPLLLATRKGYVAVVQELLNLGADVNQASTKHDSPLLQAGFWGHGNIVKLLLESGASVNVCSRAGDTILIFAARWDYSTNVRLMIERSGPLQSSVNMSKDEDESHLLLQTLVSMRSHCTGCHEYQTMFTRVIDRLQTVHSEIQKCEEGSQAEMLDILVAFGNVIFRTCRLLLKCHHQTTVSRFASSRAVTNQLEELHEAIDHLLVFSLNRNNSAISDDWIKHLNEDREDQKRTFREIVSNDTVLFSGLEEDSNKIVAVALLEYERVRHKDKYSPEDLLMVDTVLSRVMAIGSIDAPMFPEWFLSRDDVVYQGWNNFQDGNAVTSKYYGTWLKTSVTVTTCNFSPNEFEQIAMKWYQCSHPHVVELFGACHVGEPYLFVSEYFPGGTLKNFLEVEGNRRFMWQKLYEASLGLQYLQERNIVHSNAYNIYVGNGFKAKISGFAERGPLNATETKKAGQASNSTAPQVFEGKKESLASSIFSFGACIVNAITLKLPWTNLTGVHAGRYFARGDDGNFLPFPESMTKEQHRLVKDMCSMDPKARPKIAYIVNQLREFAKVECTTHHYQSNLPCEFCPERRCTSSAELLRGISSIRGNYHNLEEVVVPAFATTIPATLKKVRAKCAKFPDSADLAEQIVARLEKVFARLVQLCYFVNDAEVVKFCSILSRFEQYLRTPVSEHSYIQCERSRKVANVNHIFHSEIDRLLDMLRVRDSASIRSWRARDGKNLRGVPTLENALGIMGASTDTRKHGGVSIICFQTPTNDAMESPEKISWYLPLLELVFSEVDCIGEGSFGAIYRGVWLDTPVVVKFMGYEGDTGKVPTSLFLHEVKIWHRLSHPHIIKLFGACHIGKRYFVCEFAPHGTLSTCLQRNSDRHQVWQKLYEAALGLQYLHGQNVAHNDLKCDNILIGADFQAKLTDFGLSAIPDEVEIQVDVKKMGAVHWKSPEYLSGGRPSHASDIYSFAMCILEAVTGDVPWGKATYPVSVRHFVRKGRIPDRPVEMNDKQWNLVEVMTANDPQKRVKMGFVVEKLLEIENDGRDNLSRFAASSVGSDNELVTFRQHEGKTENVTSGNYALPKVVGNRAQQGLSLTVELKLPATFDRTCFVSLDFLSTNEDSEDLSSSSAQWTCIGISEPVRLSGMDNDTSKRASQVFKNLKIPIADDGSNSTLRFLLHVSLEEEKFTSVGSNLDRPECSTALLKVHEYNSITEISSTQIMNLFHPLLEFVTSSRAMAIVHPADAQTCALIRRNSALKQQMDKLLQGNTKNAELVIHPVLLAHGKQRPTNLAHLGGHDYTSSLLSDSFSDAFNLTPRSSESSPRMPHSKLLRDRISMGESMISGDEPGNKLCLIVRLKLPANFDRACFVSLDYFSSKEPVSGSSSLASITRKAQWKCVGTTEPVGVIGETESALSSGASNAIFPFVAVLEVPVVGHASNTLLRFLVHASTIGKRDMGDSIQANWTDTIDDTGSGSENETSATQLSYQMTMFHPLLEFVTSSQTVLDAAASGQPLDVHPTDEHTCTILEDHPSLQREVGVLLQGNMNNAELSVQTVMMPGEAPTKGDMSSHKNIGNIIRFFQYDTEDGGGGLVVEDLQESVYANAVPRQLIELLAVERQEQVEKAREDLQNLLDKKKNRLSRGLYSSITNRAREERDTTITRGWIDDRLKAISQVHDGYTTIAQEWLENRLRKRKEYVSLIRKNIQYLVNRDKRKQYFKASVEKKSEDLRFVPINLHIQDLLIGPTNAFINDEKRRSSKDMFIYALTTMGAPSAHVYDFNKGGILSYQAKLKKMQTEISEADLDLPKWPEEVREYDDLQWDLQLRMDCSFAQALAALTCSFVRKVEVAIQNPDIVKGEDMLCQLSTLGFLFQVESLLSTHGKEIGMIEDMAGAVANLSCVAFVIQDVRDKLSNRSSLSRKKDTYKEAGIVKVTVSHKNSRVAKRSSVKYVVTVQVTTGEVELPDRLVSGGEISVTPLLFTHGINEMQTIANNTERAKTELQDMININNLRLLKQFCEKYCRLAVALPSGAGNFERGSHRYKNMNQAPMKMAEEQVQQEFRALKNVILDAAQRLVKTKRPEILKRSSDLCRELGGGRVTISSNGNDRTAMSVTLEQVRILHRHHDLPDNRILATVSVMRSHGVRIENTLKNTGKRQFAFSRLQRSLLPEEYSCPNQVLGRG